MSDCGPIPTSGAWVCGTCGKPHPYPRRAECKGNSTAPIAAEELLHLKCCLACPEFRQGEGAPYCFLDAQGAELDACGLRALFQNRVRGRVAACEKQTAAERSA